MEGQLIDGKETKTPTHLTGTTVGMVSFIGYTPEVFFASIAGRILEHEPENVPALLMRANAYAHWKKAPELALADANRVLELDPDAVEAYEPRILALLDLGRLEEASASLAEAGRRLVALGSTDSVIDTAPRPDRHRAPAGGR